MHYDTNISFENTILIPFPSLVHPHTENTLSVPRVALYLSMVTPRVNPLLFFLTGPVIHHSNSFASLEVCVCEGKDDVRPHTQRYVCTDGTRQVLLLSLSAMLASSQSLIPQCNSHL